MIPDNSSSGLNESHVRHVVSTFRHIDELLARAERIMASAGAPSLFQEYADDTTPIQRKVTHDYIERLREIMSRHLEELGIPRPAPVTGALWAARTAVTFVNIALSEMESKRIGGYGKLPEEAAHRMDGLVSELRGAVGRLDDYLAQGTDADLQARLQRLERTSAEVALLAELGRMVTDYGLVEFRHSISMLLDRLENGTFEIGVFGRVGSGKSSLLNHLLGGDYLPVGVTPVTALPTYISYGSRGQVFVEFADGRPQVVELPALAEFATEQQNPGNAKHVARIRVQVPSERLSQGITFVDTPGLGSLAVGGAQETAAYLPRCDLGIVLVDAASTLTREDLQVVHAIYSAGAAAMVLVSKADLLTAADRQLVVDYVRKQVLSEVRAEPPVHVVSVVEADSLLLDEWFQSELCPMLDLHRELTQTSLKRKIGGLREALLATLKRRDNRKPAKRDAMNPARIREIDQALRSAPQILETVRVETLEMVRNIRKLEERLIEIAAGEIAVQWLRHESPAVNPMDLVSATAARLVAEESAKVRRNIEDLRAQLEGMIQTAAQVCLAPKSAMQELPRSAGLPLPDPSALAQKLILRRPAVLALFGKAVLGRALRVRLRQQLGPELQDFLDLYSQCLSGWAQETFSAVSTAFSASAEILRAQLELRFQAASSETADLSESADDGERLRCDLMLLETWDQRAATPEPGSS